MNLSQIPKPLLEWYDRSARVLAWRDDPSPYRVLLSEIMLQQTRVEAAKPYYDRFLQVLPTVRDLAEADEQLLLKLWEGLGYYNRVRNMQKAAKIVTERYGGELPCEFERLLELPGIGVYSAGAIASIAYNQPVPAVDGNVLRVISRITASRKDIGNSAVIREIGEQIRQILPKRVGDFNQALMELGATVCLPNGQPKCETCPVRDLCVANREGIQNELPVKEKKLNRKKEKKTVCLLVCGEQFALRKRPETGLLANLWEFPWMEDMLTMTQCRNLLEEAGAKVEKMTSAGNAKHIFSHIEWQMKGYLIRVSQPYGTFVWTDLREAEQRYAIPSAFSAFQGVLTDYFDRFYL